VLTASLLFSSQLETYDVRKKFVAGPLSAPLIPLLGLSRVINSLLAYLLKRSLNITTLSKWRKALSYQLVEVPLWFSWTENVGKILRR